MDSTLLTSANARKKWHLKQLVIVICSRVQPFNFSFTQMLAICRELVSVTGKEVLMVGREHILRTLAAGRMSPDSVQEEYKSHGVQFVPLRNRSGLN